MVGITRDAKDGQRRVRGVWVKPLRSSVMFVKHGGRVCAFWCVGRGLIKWNCMVVVVTKATQDGQRNAQSAHQRQLRRLLEIGKQRRRGLCAWS